MESNFTTFLKNSALMDYTNFKGSFIYDYNLTFILEKIKVKYIKCLNDHDFISISSFLKIDVLDLEKKLIGPLFNPEIFRLNDRLLKPTSEFMIYDTDFFRKKIKSINLLPYKITMVNTVYRNESRSKPLIRQNEIVYFMESHYSGDNSDLQTQIMLKTYSLFLKKLGIDFIIVKRFENDKFQGAKTTYAFETIIEADNKTLQIATIHDLDENYSKILNLKYKNKQNEFVYLKQASYGLSGQRICAKLIDMLNLNTIKSEFRIRELILFNVNIIPNYFKIKINKIHYVRTNELFLKLKKIIEAKKNICYVIGPKELNLNTYLEYDVKINNKILKINNKILKINNMNKKLFLKEYSNYALIRIKNIYFEKYKKIILQNNINLITSGITINNKYVYFCNKY